MTTLIAIVCLALIVALVVVILKSKACARRLTEALSQLADANAQAHQACEALESESNRIRTETEKSVTDAQHLLDQQVAEMRAEADRIRQHYETEAQKLVDTADAERAQARRDADDLRKYATLRDAEAQVSEALTQAAAEAIDLRAQAHALIDQARTAAETERLRATERAKAIYEQADARLNQATRDASRIATNAEARAKEIAGEAYDALRDKQLLERAAAAMRNIIEGYGDRYLIPTHSLLDDLAAEFGYTSAGESLKSARAQSRRMVEQGTAATCDYAEANRRETAIRFVIDAYNGRVDAILSRVRRGNLGTLEQEIRDAFSLVNLHGEAFRNARIQPAYLDARLNELKWAVVVQELIRRQMEEQREIKAQQRDEEKARKEYEQQMRQAAKEEEIKKRALEEKERELAKARLAFEHAATQDKAQWEQKIAAMQQANDGLRQDLAAATERKLTIAQQTKKGRVYIISNVGSFGDGIYKIGQTRRLNAQERIDELGDASVPFDFDVHAWIESENAPALEHRLHKRFLSTQLNKINSRKEFFRVRLQDIRTEVDALSRAEPFTVIHWTDMAAATQYRETRDIESDPQKLEKWFKRQEALAEREIRLDALRLSASDIADSPAEYAGP